MRHAHVLGAGRQQSKRLLAPCIRGQAMSHRLPLVPAAIAHSIRKTIILVCIGPLRFFMHPPEIVL